MRAVRKKVYDICIMVLSLAAAMAVAVTGESTSPFLMVETLVQVEEMGQVEVEDMTQAEVQIQLEVQEMARVELEVEEMAQVEVKESSTYFQFFRN